MAFVTRFAPSPTGYLHRGHAFSALTAYQAARDAGGRFVLRVTRSGSLFLPVSRFHSSYV